MQFQFLGDLTDLAFYYTDHFYAFHMLGLVRNQDLNLGLEFIGHIMCILNGFFLCFVAVFKMLEASRKTLPRIEKNTIFKICFLEMLSNFL